LAVEEKQTNKVIRTIWIHWREQILKKRKERERKERETKVPILNP